jgi:hypothetical protein
VVSSSVESDEVRRNLVHVPLRPNRLGARRGLYSVCCEQWPPGQYSPICLVWADWSYFRFSLA